MNQHVDRLADRGAALHAICDSDAQQYPAMLHQAKCLRQRGRQG